MTGFTVAIMNENSDYNKKNLTELSVKEIDHKHIAHCYKNLPVVITKGSGPYLFDINGKKYYDCVSIFGGANTGHSHPRILKALVDQTQKVCVSSRAVYNDTMSEYAQYICEYFKYDMVCPMNTGVEATETAVKLCRKWGYLKKGITIGEAKIVMVQGNFWGRSVSAVSTSSTPKTYNHYQPFTPGFTIIPYGDVAEMQKALENDPNVVAVMLEPIQGEAGVRCPPQGYLAAVKKLCEKHNCLFVADEVQSGLGRTGKLLACDHENVRPDIVCLAKSLGGAVYPVAAVLADEPIMSCFDYQEHGSTFGGNPLASAVALEALKVIKEEGLVENAAKMGELFLQFLTGMKAKYDWIKEIRGKGLFIAFEVHQGKRDPWNLCMDLCENGVLCKTTHIWSIRLTPPLVITKEDTIGICKILEEAFARFDKS